MLNTEESANNPQNPPATASTTAQTASAPDSVAGARVSAEEFSAAIQALEQRKAEEARRYANTVDVGKTIQELNIDATPEDVMREVQAQRAARSGPRLAGVPPHSQMTDAQAANREQLRSASVMLKDYYDKNLAPSRVQVGVPTVTSSWRERGRLRGRRPRWGAAIGITAFVIFIVTNIGHHHWHAAASVDDDKPAVQISLAKLAEGQTAYADTAGLESILSNGGIVNAADSGVALSSEQDDNAWTLFKSGGKLYVKAFAHPMSLSDLEAGHIEVYSTNDSGDLENATVDSLYFPLQQASADNFQVNSDDDYSEMMLDRIVPDANTRVSSYQY